MPEHYDLGVLFVHGIGGQKRGDTLLQFGEPLGASMADWLDRRAIAVRNTELAEPPSRAPAHTEVRLARRFERRRLLVAESWWAESFAVPAWWPFAKWLLWSIPFVVFRATDHRLSLNLTAQTLDKVSWRKTPSRFFRLHALRVFKNALSFVLALAFALVVLLLGVVALFPRIRASVMSAQKLLVGYIGDSYLLLNSIGRGDAMVSQVERDLQWLEEQHDVDKIVVIAHSQGAEIIRRVLARRPRGKPIASLITLGSGIAKLRAVDRLHGQAGRAARAYGWRAAAGVMTLTPPVLAALGTIPWWAAPIGALLSPPLIDRARKPLIQIVDARKLHCDRVAAVVGKTERWLDFFATSDPVPEGELPLTALPDSASVEIANRRSPLLDHTSYWQNGEAFRAPIVEELARLMDWELSPWARARIAAARETRRQSSVALRTSRWTVGAVAALLLALPALGAGSGAWNSAAKGLGRAADWVIAYLPGKDEAWLAQYPEHHLVAVAAVALLAVVTHGTYASVWYGAAGRRARDLFRPPEPPEADEAPVAPSPSVTGPTPA